MTTLPELGRHIARLHYTKRGKVRFLGHRDVARNLERAFRITQLPLVFSEGFNPHPKISFGLALTTGFESEAEYVDVEFAELIDLEALPVALTAALPPGIEVVRAVWLIDRAPALQEAVTSVVWHVEVLCPDDTALGERPADVTELESAMAIALASEQIEHTKVRKGRTVSDDIRPVIRRLELVEPHGIFKPSDAPILELELASKGAKPAEVLAAIGPFIAGRGLRLHQYIERAGERIAPIAADVRAPLAGATA
jgi:radical SAM-linked protein